MDLSSFRRPTNFIVTISPSVTLRHRAKVPNYLRCNLFKHREESPARSWEREFELAKKTRPRCRLEPRVCNLMQPFRSKGDELVSW